MRLTDPDKYVRVRRENDKFGAGIHAIWGVTRDGAAELQAIRFDKTKFTVTQAKAWLDEHDHKPILFEPASDGTEGAALLAALPAAFAPASHERLEGGIERKRFRKDLISLGTYIHPVHKWKLAVTRERIDKWVAAFKAMADAGVRVPIPAGHSYDPRDGMGFLVELSRDGDTLWGMCEFIGQDAITCAYRTQQVSISINPHFVDGKGTDYGEVIEHVALTGYPVVPDQQDFKAIAASLYVLANNVEKGDERMTPEQLTKLQELLGLTEPLTAETAFAAIETKLLELHTKLTDLQTKLDALVTAGEEAKDIVAEVVPEVDVEVIDDRAESAEEQIDTLVQAGKILPAVAASLKLALIGAKGKRFALGLSGRLSKTSDSITKQVIAALKLNDPVKLGEHTESQNKELSRKTPEADAAVKAVSNDVARRRKAAGLKD